MTTTTDTLPEATELEQFYADVIVGAIEGGDARFLQVETWGEHVWGHAHTTVARIVDIQDDAGEGTALLPEGVTLPLDVGIKQIGAVFARFAAMLDDDTIDVGIHAGNVGRYLSARIAKDAGEIDAYDAAAIIQVAVFGKAIFG